MARISATEIKIHFEASEAVKRLQFQRHMRVGSNTVVVEFLTNHWLASRNSFVAGILLEPPAQDSPMNILNALNDDCLRTIFEAKMFDVYNLAVIASVCTRFNRIVTQNHAIMNKNLGKHLKGVQSDETTDVLLWRSDELFRNFGAAFTQLNLRRLPNQSILLGMVTKYCKNLSSLTCEVGDQSSIRELCSLASRLQKLHLTLRHNGTSAFDLDRLFEPKAMVETLELCSYYGPLKLPTIRLPVLKHLHLNKVHLSDKISTETFFVEHSHIEKLTIRNSELNFEAEEKIAEYTSNSECSRKWHRSEDFSCFDHLKCLRKLRFKNNVTGPKCIMHAINAANVKLEFLVIKNPWRLFKAIDDLCHMTSIRFLDIEIDFEDQMIRVLRNLINLREIRVKSDAIGVDGIFRGLDAASDTLTKAFFGITKHWGDQLLVGDGNDKIAAISDICNRRRIDVEIVVKAKFYGILVGAYSGLSTFVNIQVGCLIKAVFLLQ